MPVVGWLVCIEGNDRGRDFRLHAGYNSIGKNPENDVSIPSDHTISRDRHAVIAYDQEENLYFFAPANGVNLLRLNGKVLMSPSEIKANDILTIGKSKLMFIPLCSDKFQWGKDEE
jgi:pSer/pThr/pTyr-binding forkhead associated (FHA) protein